MHIEHNDGDKIYIDFSGEKLHLVDKETGEIADVDAFLSVLRVSQLLYMRAVHSQCKEYITAIESML